jgi:RimJ/RimL family protein N-acetyltransferase
MSQNTVPFVECHTLRSTRLVLEPLISSHALQLFAPLADARLYTYLDELPPKDVLCLAARYERLAARRSRNGSEHWLNWAIAVPALGANGYVGYVQATAHPDHRAEIAYVLFTAHQGHGYGREAVQRMLTELAQRYGICECYAQIDQRNKRSIALVTALEFVLTDRVNERTLPDGAAVHDCIFKRVLSQAQP